MKLAHIGVPLSRGDSTSDDMVAINDLLNRGASLVATHAVAPEDRRNWMVVYVLDISDLYEGPL